jgi:hypothetical protein
MMFDAPGAWENTATQALVWALVFFPISCLVAVILSLQALKAEKLGQAFLWVCLPLISLAVGAAGLAWIQIYQGGRFAG